MKLPRLAYKGRKLRRLSVVSGLSVLMLVAFGASFALAQESRTFLPWSTFGNGAAQMTSTKNIMRGVIGQNAVGSTFSDDDLDDRFEVILGFQTRALASDDAFAELIGQLALTPVSTPVPVATETPTPEPTAEATEVPASPTAQATAEATAEATATPEPVGDTPTPPPATSTPFPRQPTATPVPITEVPTTEPTVEPTSVVAVETTLPEPTETPLSAPEATATPFILVVTSVPEPEPSPTVAPPPPPPGGICSAPSTHGPSPLDLGWLMLLVAPLALWRFGRKP